MEDNDKISASDFIDQFKFSMGSYDCQEQFEICKSLHPYINYVLEHQSSPYERQTKQVQLQLKLLIQNDQLFDSNEVREYFGKIIDNTKVLTFDAQRLDFYIKTRVLINFNNLFVVVRAYDGCCEGGGHCDIHIKDGMNSKSASSDQIQLFKKNNFENSLEDVNDEELLNFYDRLIVTYSSNCSSPVKSDGETCNKAMKDCIITYEQFKVFVAELFLSDFDY